MSVSEQTAKRCRVYRFNELVAVSLGDGETRYIEPDLAGQLAMALRTVADDIHVCKFTDSNIGTLEFGLTE